MKSHPILGKTVQLIASTTSNNNIVSFGDIASLSDSDIAKFGKYTRLFNQGISPDLRA